MLSEGKLEHKSKLLGETLVPSSSRAVAHCAVLTAPAGLRPITQNLHFITSLHVKERAEGYLPVGYQNPPHPHPFDLAAPWLPA